jgi:2-polyprenyl-3-methyl-5-hydroxy-6-metoxy-1,4-benzoquinol methylase
MSERAFSRMPVGDSKSVSHHPRPLPRLPWFFMLPRDIGLFVKSARTDARIARLHREKGAREAFEAVYTESADPWASASSRYRYQRLKYDRLIALLPQRRLGNVLDLGCGLGLLSQKLAECADRVLGIDIAVAAIDRARRHGAAFANLQFKAGDILDLPPSLDRKFDLVVVADVLYYLMPLDDQVLKSVVRRIANLLNPGGMCLVANHYFFSADPDSRRSRKIHRAFLDCPRFAMMSEHRRAFFLATLFSERSQLAAA